MDNDFFLFTASADSADFLSYFLVFASCSLLMLFGLLVGWIVWNRYGNEAQRLDDENRRLGRILNSRENTCRKHREKISRLTRSS